MKLRYLYFLLLFSGVLLEGASRVELQNGSALEGVVLSEDAERVVVDLGYMVTTVPAAWVVDVLRLGETEVESVAEGSGFYTEGSGGRGQPVHTLSAQVGGAVVLVKTPIGLGSGFIINADGYVVTNHHVVAGEYRISVTLFEQENGQLVKKQFEKVRIVATHPDADLALLQLLDDEGRRFPFVSIGDSDALEAGEEVFAIGSPLGLERSVSQGIISIKNRLIDGRLYIQTTTEINPGNSGGPLFNLFGQVVGVNNMKLAATGIEGLGFSIPSATLKNFLSNQEAFAFDPLNPNAGFRYFTPAHHPEK